MEKCILLSAKTRTFARIKNHSGITIFALALSEKKFTINIKYNRKINE